MMKRFHSYRNKITPIALIGLFVLCLNSCMTQVPPQTLELTLKVNTIPNPDSLQITPGSPVTFQWIGRRGESDLTELTVSPPALFADSLTTNGKMISSTGSYPATFDTPDVYADQITIPVSADTLFSFTLQDLNGNEVVRTVWIYL